MWGVRVYCADVESVYSLRATYLSEGSGGDGGFGGLGGVTSGEIDDF